MEIIKRTKCPFQAVDKVKKSTAFSFQMKEYMVLYPLSWMTSFQVRKL